MRAGDGGPSAVIVAGTPFGVLTTEKTTEPIGDEATSR